MIPFPWKATPVLKSFEIRGFRTFKELKIESLGQVNLIVGKNNVGKTTLLEALRLYASNASSREIDAILLSRGERPITKNVTPSEVNFGSLFFGRTPSPTEGNEICLREIERPESEIRIRLVLLERIEESEPKGRIRYEELTDSQDAAQVETEPGFAISIGGIRFLMPLNRFERGWDLVVARQPAKSVFIPAHGIPDSQLVRWWDGISLYDAEDHVYECLRIVSPVRAIKTIQESTRSNRRVFRVRLDGMPAPMPLAALGHGATRIMQVVVAAEHLMRQSTAPQPSLFPEINEGIEVPFLLVDEIENGIYYDFLPDLWRFIFRLSSMNRLQVFATTHSKDCVDAFLRVSEEEKDVDGKLIRIEGRDTKRRAKHFDESEFGIIRESKIEVR